MEKLGRREEMLAGAGWEVGGRAFLSVILSDERSEESKDPYSREKSQFAHLAKQLVSELLVTIGFLRLLARSRWRPDSSLRMTPQEITCVRFTPTLKPIQPIFRSKSAEFFDPKAMQLQTACSISTRLPASGT